MTRALFAALTAAAALALTACQSEAPETANADPAVTNEIDVANDATKAPQQFAFAGADGTALGSVTVTEDASGLMLAVSATGMPVGTHGIHLHDKGLCEGPKFESAGAHWNPQAKQHGRDNPAGSHMGDLVNLVVNADGSAKTNFPIAGAMMASGAMMLADADGTALVVHAKPDDYKTDPSGASGDRIACAVIAAAK
ncbi:MAG: superoxide dismutase family protein [Sphingomonas bacterium]|nr:superoxide dismutase family protein [Sphingomonas bacterium]